MISHRIFHPKSGLLAFTPSDPNTLYVYDTKLKQNLHKIVSSSHITCLSFNSNGSYLSSGTANGSLHSLNIKNGKSVEIPKHHFGRITALCFKKGTNTIISAGEDKHIKSYDFENTEILINLNAKGTKRKNQEMGIPHLLALNAAGTKVLVAVNTSIFMYSVEDGTLLQTYEGHAEVVTSLQFSNEGKDVFVSIAHGEQFALVWRPTNSKDVVTSPTKMLQLDDASKCDQVSLFHLAGDFYISLCMTQTELRVYLVNLKKSKKNLVQKLDTVLRVNSHSKSFQLIASSFKNDTEVMLYCGSIYSIESHRVKIINEEGEIVSKSIEIQSNSSEKKLKEVQQINDSNVMSLDFDKKNPKYGNSSLFEGKKLNELTQSLFNDGLDTPAKGMVSGSLVTVLTQSLHSNDVETINWALSNTDVEVISDTIKGITRQTIHQLMTNLFIQFQQNLQKATLLWLSAVLKYRWSDVMKFHADPMFN